MTREDKEQLLLKTLYGIRDLIDDPYISALVDVSIDEVNSAIEEDFASNF
jgi:hypothetical protein